MDIKFPVSMFERNRSSESYVYKKSNLILWAGKGKKTPTPPDPSVNYTEMDGAYWYDMEYGYLDLEKLPCIPSPKTGPKGKKVICVKAESDAYQKECEKSMIHMANALGMELSIVVTGWDAKDQNLSIHKALEEKPDLIINIPGLLSSSCAWYSEAYAKKIPIISSTLTPENEAFKYIIAWCGHDAWLESRMLAHKFAELMDYSGAYCLIQHMPDTSAFYSRTYGLVTELHAIAPKMQLLAMETSYLRTDTTEQIVSSWFDKYGDDIKGLVSPNDIAVLHGINKAVKSNSCSHVIRVSNGTTREGLKCMKSGEVEALTFKSPELDGALPVQIAADWFNGLVVDPIRFLRKYSLNPQRSRNL